MKHTFQMVITVEIDDTIANYDVNETSAENAVYAAIQAEPALFCDDITDVLNTGETE